MKVKNYWALPLILLVCFAGMNFTNQVAGKAEQPTQENPQFKFIKNQRDVLAGLQGVYVNVERFSPEAQKYGFTRDKYKTNVESQLRKYGIKVLSKKGQQQIAGAPELYININMLIDENRGIVAGSLNVFLYEGTLLIRNQKVVVSSVVWQRSSAIFTRLFNINQVRESVSKLLDSFIKDYQTVNSK